MLKTYEAIYDHGKIEWLGTPPPDARLRIKVLFEQPDASPEAPPRRRRAPPPELKGSVTWVGDPTESLFTEAEWEEFHDRTARQIAGDPEAFR
ncbi:hypothetical protein [Methylomagnum sp.]